MDDSKLASVGWRPKVSLREGVAKAYDAFLQTLEPA
jgi:hypothetical protein